ncbi:YicC family protein [Clostridium sp. SHJSY1]|uniref:YicC/YloC family endoribonuclease n=1 Tax=Clostridium sp. SHJSY1 TaxID=2942483 RepID=UPI002874F7C9|nr:YicC/YloC family endoribonuclease [Clostridium sp. SHJSY1]MDS0524952.1 YicC family protein [Clostridium sp. SHJSY1]
MIKSMTSFGRAQGEEGKEYLFSIEMKSVNNRYLDINIRLPKFMIALEEEIRKIINKKLNRGKVDVFINCKSYGKGNVVPKLNVDLAKEYYNCLKKLSDTLEIENDITLSKIAEFPEVIILEAEEENIEEILEEVAPLLTIALDKMVEMRIIEGEKLKEDILLKLSSIEENVKRIESLAEEVPKQYKRKLEERLIELTNGMSIDEERIAMEIAIFSDKAAVDEEITRLYSHISQMRKTLNLDEPVGRKLDFIVQEMNRETNTIGSKCNDMDMTNLVINIKNLIEKIREQVQNIE